MNQGSWAATDTYRNALIANALVALDCVLGFEKTGWDTTQIPWIAAGVLALATSMLCLFSGGSMVLIALGVLLFTVGEVLLFPLPDILAARIAEPGSEGRLMGLVDIRYFGFFAGPALGGYALSHSNMALAVSLTLFALSLLPIFIIILRRTAK